MKKVWGILLVFMILLGSPIAVLAEDLSSRMLDELDLSSLDEITEELPQRISFGDLVQEFVENGFEGLSGSTISQYVFDLFFYELAAVKPLFVELLCVSLLFALFGKLLVSGQEYVSKMGFLIVYTGILLLLLQSFSQIGQVVEEGMDKIVSFLTAFIPTYAATLLVSGNATSAGVFYELTFGMIYVLELAMKLFFLPGVHVFVLLVVMDHLFEENRLSKLAGLLEDAIRLALKLGMGVVLGVGVVQSLLAPAKDRLATSSVYQGIEAIPGVGNTLGATGEILVGCGILIKNCVGTAALVVLFVITAAPLLKVFGFQVMYRLVSALLEPFCDKRIVQCVHDVGRACGIYGKLLLDAMLLFLITIALIAASTSFIY